MENYVKREYPIDLTDPDDIDDIDNWIYDIYFSSSRTCFSIK